jgi:hypothetical protein
LSPLRARHRMPWRRQSPAKILTSLIEQYGEDPGMEMDEYKDGYKMLRDESMMPEFLEASFKLQGRGDIRFGCHRLRLPHNQGI